MRLNFWNHVITCIWVSYDKSRCLNNLIAFSVYVSIIRGISEHRAGQSSGYAFQNTFAYTIDYIVIELGLQSMVDEVHGGGKIDRNGKGVLNR